MQPMQRWWDAAGVDTPLLYYTGIMGRSFIAVLDADAVKLILTSSASAEHPRFIKGFFYLKNVIGNGLVTLEGSDWHRHRRIIQPSFNTYHLKESLNSCVPGMVQRMIKCWKERPNADIDVSGHFSALTLDIIGKVAFSHDFHSLSAIEAWSKEGTNEIELGDDLIKSLYESLSPSTTRMLLINFGLSWLIRFVLPALHETQVLLDKAVDSVVQKAHEKYRTGGIQRDGQNPPSDVKCLLELLFDAKDLESSSNRTLTHKELQAEMKTFIVAGHETTATLCNWAIYCLIRYPHIQDRVVDDIKKNAPHAGTITLDLLDKMDYFDAFLNEVLRLYPPVGLITRTNTIGINLLGEFIPKNTRIFIPIFLLHRHPKYWTDPLEFKPERWLKSKREDEKFHHFAYLPFSAGGRNCIGQKFAIYEAKLILAPVIREFEIKASPLMDDADIKLKSFITTKSDPPIVMRVVSRC